MLGSRTCLGVDVGARDIKIVELRMAGRKYEVVQAARIALAGGDDPDCVSAALERFLVETSTSAANVVCSLPANACSIKFTQVPRASRADLAKLVRFEAESQIPLPLSELVWNFAAEVDRSSPMCHVVIAGARTAVVDQNLAIMAAAHARPSAMLVSSLAGAKAVGSPAVHKEPSLVLDIGGAWSDMCVIDDGKVFGCRSVRVGSDDLAEAIASDMGVDAEEAQCMMQSQGISQDTRPSGATGVPPDSAIAGWVESTAQEIRRSAVSLGSDTSCRRPQRLILIGGLAGVPGVAEALARETGLTAEVGDPWAGMRLGDVCSHTLREPSAAFAVATGLARSGLDREPSIDLMPRHIAKDRLLKRKEAATVAGLALVGAVLLAVLLAGGPSLHAKSAELRKINKQVRLVQGDIRGAGPNFRAAATEVTQVLGRIERKNTGALGILRETSAVMPRGISLSQFSFDTDKSVVLKGSAISNSAVADAVDILSQLESFDGIKLDHSNLAGGDGSQGYEFQMTCAIPAAKTEARHPGAGRNTGLTVR